MSEFTEFIEEALGDRTIDQVVQTAKEKGFTISRSAAYKYRSGHVTKPDPVTLNALAAGLGVDPRKLRRLAGLPAGELGPWIPPDVSVSLTKAQRNALDDLIKAIVSGEGESSVSTSKPRKKSPNRGAAGTHVVDVTPPPVRRRPVIRFPRPYDPDNPTVQDGQEETAASTPSEREQRKIDERERRQEQRGEENQDHGGGRE